VELMLAKSLPDLKKYAAGLQVCIVGAGKMGRLLLIALFSKQPDIHVTLVNRSVDKAEALLEELSNRGGSNASVVGLDKMWETVKASDVVFAATSSKEPIIKKADLADLERNMMLVDISVPRNIAADCGEAERVVSYSVDDLKKVQQANNAKRQREVIKAQRFILEEVAKFTIWKASQGAVPYLAAMQTMAEAIRKQETEKMSRKLKGLHEKEKLVVDKLTRHIVDSMLRPIYYSMKDHEDIEAKKNKIWALKQIYKLEPEYKRRLLPQGASNAQLNA
jgi:glutamyl-tRNA reductase